MTDKKDALEAVAQQLLDKEVLFQADLVTLLGARPFEHDTVYQDFVSGKVEAASEALKIKEAAQQAADTAAANKA